MYYIEIDGEDFFCSPIECLANFALEIAMIRFRGHEVLKSYDHIFIC